MDPALAHSSDLTNVIKKALEAAASSQFPYHLQTERGWTLVNRGRLAQVTSSAQPQKCSSDLYTFTYLPLGKGFPCQRGKRISQTSDREIQVQSQEPEKKDNPRHRKAMSYRQFGFQTCQK